MEAWGHGAKCKLAYWGWEKGNLYFNFDVNLVFALPPLFKCFDHTEKKKLSKTNCFCVN